MIDLYEIRIERFDRNDGHSDITVMSTDWTDPAVVAQYRFTERVAAARHVAAVLAKVAGEIGYILPDLVRRCGCTGERLSGCRLSAGLIEPVYQAHDNNDEPIPDRFRLSDYEPSLDIRVATSQVEVLVQRIEVALSQIADADAIEVTDDMEAPPDY